MSDPHEQPAPGNDRMEAAALATFFTQVRRWWNIALRVIALALVFTLAYWGSFWIRFDGAIPDLHLTALVDTLPFVVVIKLLVFRQFGVASGWRGYITFRDLGALAEAVTLSSLLIAVGDQLVDHVALPRSVFLLDWGGTLLITGGLRATYRMISERYQPLFVPRSQRVRALIVGASPAGENLLRSLDRHPQRAYQVVGFVDDAPHRRGERLGGLQVLGTLDEVPLLANRLLVSEILVIADQLPGRRLRELHTRCRELNLAVKVLPSYEQLLEGDVAVKARDVSIADLLRRDPVQLDQNNIRQWLAGKTLMVTGSSGSIGSEICRQLLPFGPASLVLIDRAENGQFYLQREISMKAGSTSVHTLVADIADTERMRTIFERFRPDIIFHAAAYKHVAMMEENPGEAVKNNVGGTRRLADLAEEFGVNSLVMISTDKAVNPTSVMGACKRLAELYVQSCAQESSCRFVTVRFGNVLDSSGSVVPIFREQIARGGPVTVTDPQMQRYFMTIPEAAQLVVQAGAMGQGGEIFVLDMGEPVRILDLAMDMIRLSGFRAGHDIEIQFIGPRKGEKLSEELHRSSEEHLPTRHPKIVVARSEPRARGECAATIDRLLRLAERSDAEVLAELHRAVPEYHTDEQPRLKIFSPDNGESSHRAA